MQALQPKIKDLQKRYKSNKQKQQEETMKLYKEAGVNPLGGCLPMLLTLPFLFAMYAVIRPPALAPAQTADGQQAYVVVNNHLPIDSTLYDVVSPESRFPVINLQCSRSAGRAPTSSSRTTGPPLVPERRSGAGVSPGRPDVPFTLDCGSEEVPDAIPYGAVAAHDGDRHLQQRQMTGPALERAVGFITEIQPLMYGVWGWAFGGPDQYWTPP